MRRKVKQAVSWIEEFERKATQEVDRIDKVDSELGDEVKKLQEQITDIKDDQGVLTNSRKKIENLLKALNGN